MKAMGRKKRVNLYIDEEVVRKARKAGLKRSVIAEKAFIEATKRLEGLNSPEKVSIGTCGSDLAGPRGFEPRTSGSAGQRPNPG